MLSEQFVPLKIILSVCSFNNGSINSYIRLTKTSKHVSLTSSLSNRTKNLLQDKVKAMMGGGASEVSATLRVVPVQLLQGLAAIWGCGKGLVGVLVVCFDARFVQVPIGFSYHN